MRRIFTGDVAAAALDAQILVDVRLDRIVQVQVFPVDEVRHGFPDEVGECAVSLLVHPVVQAVDHVFHHLEAVDHRRGADLDVVRAERHELGGIAPGRDAADSGDRHSGRLAVAGDLTHHAQRNRLDRRPAVTAVRSPPIHTRAGRHQVEIHTHDGADGVDQRNRIRSAAQRSAGGLKDVGYVGRELHDHRQTRVLIAPARNDLNVLRNLAHRRAHAALRHAMGAAEVKLDAVGTGILDHRQDPLPCLLFAGNHQ